MYQRHRDGANAEHKALVFLRKNRLKLLEKNFRSSRGEVDLIMTDTDTVVFIEVRLRRRKDYVGALESIDSVKQKRIKKTAEYYLQTRGLSFSASCRFDVIALDGDSNDIQWIKNAF